MGLISNNNNFVILFPSDFFMKETNELYQQIISKNNILSYENFADYASSNIKKITVPSFNIPLKEQTNKGTSVQNFISSGSEYQLVDNRTITINFSSVDDDLLYKLLLRDLIRGYVDREKFDGVYRSPVKIHVLDSTRDNLFDMYFEGVIFYSISEMSFEYNNPYLTDKEFSITINFNTIDILDNINNESFLTVDKSRIIRR